MYPTRKLCSIHFFSFSFSSRGISTSIRNLNLALIVSDEISSVSTSVIIKTSNLLSCRGVKLKQNDKNCKISFISNNIDSRLLHVLCSQEDYKSMYFEHWFYELLVFYNQAWYCLIHFLNQWNEPQIHSFSIYLISTVNLILALRLIHTKVKFVQHQ